MIGAQSIRRFLRRAERGAGLRRGSSPNGCLRSEPRFSVSPIKGPVITEHDVPVTARDSVTLHTNVCRSSVPDRYPALVALALFGKDNFDLFTFTYAIASVNLGEVGVSNRIVLEPPNSAVRCVQGYAVVHADVRGQGNSGVRTGSFDGKFSEDCFDLIEWSGLRPVAMGELDLTVLHTWAYRCWPLHHCAPPHLKPVVWRCWCTPSRRFYYGSIPETAFAQWLWDRWIITAHIPKSPSSDPDFPSTALSHPFRETYWTGETLCTGYPDQTFQVFAPGQLQLPQGRRDSKEISRLLPQGAGRRDQCPADWAQSQLWRRRWVVRSVLQHKPAKWASTPMEERSCEISRSHAFSNPHGVMF